MKSKGLFLVLTLRKVMLVVGVSILIATLLVSGCAAPKGEAGFGKTIKVPRQKALLVPPGPEVEPVKVDELGHPYYDLNGNGIIDCYVESDGFRMFNYLEDVLGNRFGFGWETEQKAKGVKLFGSMANVAIEDAPDNVWVGNFYIDNNDEYIDLSTDEKMPATDEMKERAMKVYVTRRPHASLGGTWVVEYRGNERLYYPFEDGLSLIGHWPLTMEDWREIKAKGPVLIEYW